MLAGEALDLGVRGDLDRDQALPFPFPTASDRSSIVSGSSAVIAYSFLYSAPDIATVPLPASTVNVQEKVTCVAIDVRSTSVEYWPSELAYVRVQVVSPPPPRGSPSPSWRRCYRRACRDGRIPQIGRISAGAGSSPALH